VLAYKYFHPASSPIISDSKNHFLTGNKVTQNQDNNIGRHSEAEIPNIAPFFIPLPPTWTAVKKRSPFKFIALT
jgi:hypothetical protein